MAVATKRIPAPDLHTVRRALLSVSDKTGLIELAKALVAQGVELVSTGGTAKAIERPGCRQGCQRVHQFSRNHGWPRQDVAPLCPWRASAIRDDGDHVAAMIEHEIPEIDMP